MKTLAIIGIVMALIAAIGVVFLIFSIAWLAFEDTRIGREITNAILQKFGRW